jgi:hypothetical protein
MKANLTIAQELKEYPFENNFNIFIKAVIQNYCIYNKLTNGNQQFIFKDGSKVEIEPI